MHDVTAIAFGSCSLSGYQPQRLLRKWHLADAGRSVCPSVNSLRRLVRGLRPHGCTGIPKFIRQGTRIKCLRLRAAQCTLFIAGFFFAVYQPPLFSQAAAPPPSIEITSTPSTGIPGNSKLGLTIQPSDPKNCTNSVATPLTLVVPSGNGIDLLSQSPQAGCIVFANISIEKGAVPNTTVLLWLQDKNGKLWGKPFAFQIVNIAVPAAPGPIPPGMKPALDVMWGVVPDVVVHDEFGHYISKKFFCIEVVIGNDTGYPVQIAAVGFSMYPPDKNKAPIPSSAYRTTRAMLEVGQLENPRGYVVASLGIIGTVGAGVFPFFHNVNHKANFEAVIDLASNPLEKGFELLVPDLTVSELNRLDDTMLRDNLIVPNNTQARTMVFVPKSVVLPYLENVGATKDSNSEGQPATGKHDSADPNRGSGNHTECAWRGLLKCKWSTNTKDVMIALGTLSLIGSEVQYINRVQVNSTPNTPSVSLTPSSLAFTTNGSQKVVLTNTGTAPLHISKIDPAPGSSADDFSQSNDCPAPPGALAQGSLCTITATFTPTVAGKHQAMLSISDDAGNSPQTVSLTANWSPSITAPPLDLPDKSPHSITLKNTAATSLTIKSVDPTGNNAKDFKMVNNNCLKALGAGTTCDTSVQFTGSGSSEQTTLDIRDDKGNLIGLVNVTGPK